MGSPGVSRRSAIAVRRRGEDQPGHRVPASTRRCQSRSSAGGADASELSDLAFMRSKARVLGAHVTQRHNAGMLSLVAEVTGVVDVWQMRTARRAAGGRCLEDSSTETGDSPAHGSAPVNRMHRRAQDEVRLSSLAERGDGSA